MDGFLSSAVFIHPSIHLSHHIPTWDPAPPKSHHQICFVFASQQRISHRRRGEGGIHFWKNKPIFFPPRVESNAAEPLGPITVNKQPLPSVFWSAEGEPVRRAAAVFIGRRSHLEARPVGGVCPRFESVCRLLSLEQMENAQVGDSCRRRRRRCFLCCCFLCRCFFISVARPKLRVHWALRRCLGTATRGSKGRDGDTSMYWLTAPGLQRASQRASFCWGSSTCPE